MYTFISYNVCIQEPQRITLKETSTHRLAGRQRKIVVSKTEIMYIPLLETLQAQLNNSSIFMRYVPSTFILCQFSKLI